MPGVLKETIFQDLLAMLNKLAEDWEYSEEITPKTLLVADLGFESIDVVVLATNIEKHYQQPLPFAGFYTTIAEREIKDIALDELVDFIHQHLNGKSSV